MQSYTGKLPVTTAGLHLYRNQIKTAVRQRTMLRPNFLYKMKPKVRGRVSRMRGRQHSYQPRQYVNGYS